MDRKPGRPRALTVDMIAQAALDDGISTFSMPSVARRLGVAHSGLYRYVTNREDLLGKAVDHAVRAWEWPALDQPWDEQLRSLGDSIWTLCEHYDGLDQAAMDLVVPSHAVREIAERHVRALEEAGFEEADAQVAVEFVVWLSFSSSTLVKRLPKIREYEEQATEPFTRAYASEEFYTGRGSYGRKLEIALAGLSLRQLAPRTV